MRRFLAFLPLVLILTLFACARSAGDPRNTVLAEIAPPGGTMKAVIFERTGGPGGAPTTQVSVLPLEETLPHGPGNVFISDASSAPGRGIKVKWTGPAELKIAYPTSTGVYRNETQLSTIAVTYEIFEAPPAPATPTPADAPSAPDAPAAPDSPSTPDAPPASGPRAEAEPPSPEPAQTPPPGHPAPEPPANP